MKLLESYLVLSNILVAVVLVVILLIVMPFHALSDPDSPHIIVILFIGAVLTAIGIFALILIPVIAPSGLMILGGMWMAGGAEQGTLVQGIGSILAITGLCSLWLFGTYMCESYTARYWRMQWSKRSFLERLTGPVAPYNEMPSDFSSGSSKFKSTNAEEIGGMSFNDYRHRQYQQKQLAKGKSVPSGFR